MNATMNRWACRLAVIATSALAVLMSPLACAAEAADQGVAKAVSVQGTVEVRRAGETQWQQVKLNDTFRPGDTIRVQERSRADVALLNQSVLRLNANSTITVEAPKEGKTGVIDMVRGAAHFFARGPNSLEVKTPFTVAGVRGTEFLVNLESQATLLTVFEGTVVAQNATGSLTMTDGQSAIAEAGKAPVTRVVARPRDAVQWTLYYPPVLYFSVNEFPAGDDWRGMVRRSVESNLQGDLRGALEQIQKVPADVRDARLYVYRAQLLLAVGQVDAARADIQRAREITPNDADAASLLTIMAIVQGDKDGALQIAQSAVAAAPESAAARIALSYAQQARFDLAGARADLERAVELDPRNALAWARLAELQSSFGERAKSKAAAEKAVALEPNLARTQTVLGFAYLTSINTRQAREAFDKAIALDQADPLPRLGLGLAKIRDGELDAGSREIEVAASLDPSNSLVRSYLGKAYFEEKRSPRDEREFQVAKQLDPMDPTPWFYDAIAKQTTNRPVEALQDVEKAIELNDNRAVFRSKLLLDSDAAARSASLGRIYGDLGFQELALTEGWKSVNIDPTNFSAHRLLADDYSALPRHEIARVSELLQSQLLQPVGLTPIQPRLAQSNLFLISAGGPGALSFNEYNQLFTGNGFNVQASGLVGDLGTSGGELVVSGLKDSLAFSIGGFHYQTDGWRTNASERDTIADVFLQKDFSPDTGVQFEYRYRDIDTGDLQMYYFQDNARAQLTTSAKTESYRLGLRHAFAPNSIVLASLLYQDDQRQARDASNPDATAFIDEPNTRTTSVELQHLYRSPGFNTVGGVGSYRLDRQQSTAFEVPGLSFTSTESLDASVTHTNVYLYAYLNVLSNVTFTLGASGDFFKSDGSTVTTTDDPLCIFDVTGTCVPFSGPTTATTSAPRSKDRFNPKLGVTWNPLPDTTLRAAWFRVMKRALISNQTLEPTQVAGFNQFYDDIEATRSTIYGAAVDQKFSRTLFGGLASTWRDLQVPIPFLDPFTGTSETVDKDWSERLIRAYLFWTPHPWWALSAEYQDEHFRRTNDGLNFGVQEATTKKVPLGVRFFHPSGLTLGAKATYVSQDGLFQPKGGSCNPCLPGNSSFWLTDLVLSYRLPNRYGFLSVGATNLSDRSFQYQETDFNNPTILPRRMVYARLTLALP
jgi:tetratricopeptide (TPR) repeat protein